MRKFMNDLDGKEGQGKEGQGQGDEQAPQDEQQAFDQLRKAQQRMEEAILRAIEVGEIHAVSARQTMLTIVSSCIFCFLMAPTVKVTNPEAREDFDAFVTARKKHVFDIVYNGLRARQES